MNKKIMHEPLHPGEVLKEAYLETLGLSITDTAKALKVTRKTLSSIINKKSGISPVMAVRLSKAFDTTPQLWLNIQQSYDLWNAVQNTDIEDVNILRAAS